MSWQEDVRRTPIPGLCVGGLPNRRTSGNLPEIHDSQILDFMSGSVRKIAQELHGRPVSREVGTLYFTKTQIPEELFVKLLNRDEYAHYNDIGPFEKRAYLEALAVSKYLSVLEGCGWTLIPQDGLSKDRSGHEAPGFTKTWLESPTRVDDRLRYVLHPNTGVMTPTETIITPPNKELILLL